MLPDMSEIFGMEGMFEEPPSKRNKTISGNNSDTASMSSYTSGNTSSSADELKKSKYRESNRLHAAATRQRKKAYADELAAKLEALTAESKAKADAEQKAKAEVTEQQNARIAHLRKVMDVRTNGCLDENVWSTVLTEDFKLILPVTPYRSFAPSDIVNNRRILLGVEGMVADTASLMVMLDNIGIKTKQNESRVKIEYLLGSDAAENCFFGDSGLMCTFLMRTIDARQHGAVCECEKSGIIRARFADEGPLMLEELEMTFDGIAMYHQLMRASGQTEFPLVPNTLSTVLKDQKNHIVITTAQRPFTITHVNSAWTSLCGFELGECKGKSLAILQGELTDMQKVKELCHISERGMPASVVLTNYAKDGRPFRNHLRVVPVSSDDSGVISHMVGYLEEVFDGPAPKTQ